MMTDKRDECGCHHECTTLPHTCDKPCQWPACLTPEEEYELVDEVWAFIENPDGPQDS